jgi:hypothetical protein
VKKLAPGGQAFVHQAPHSLLLSLVACFCTDTKIYIFKNPYCTVHVLQDRDEYRKTVSVQSISVPIYKSLKRSFGKITQIYILCTLNTVLQVLFVYKFLKFCVYPEKLSSPRKFRSKKGPNLDPKTSRKVSFPDLEPEIF